MARGRRAKIVRKHKLHRRPMQKASDTPLTNTNPTIHWMPPSSLLDGGSGTLDHGVDGVYVTVHPTAGDGTACHARSL